MNIVNLTNAEKWLLISTDKNGITEVSLRSTVLTEQYAFYPIAKLEKLEERKIIKIISTDMATMKRVELTTIGLEVKEFLRRMLELGCA